MNPLLAFIFAAEDDGLLSMFPKWNKEQMMTQNVNALIFLLVFLVAVYGLYRLLLRKTAPVRRPSARGGVIPLPRDVNAPLLRSGDGVWLADDSERLTVKIVAAGEQELVVMTPRDTRREFTVGSKLSLVLNVEADHYAVKTTLARLDRKNSGILFLTLPHPLTIKNLRAANAITTDLPALLGVIPKEFIAQPCVPFADLHQKALAEIPATATNLTLDAASFRTASPVKFKVGDLLLAQMAIPDSPEEISLWCDIAATYPADGGLTVIMADFLTMDDNLARLNADVGRPLTL